MLDLGNSFRASVERDPNALAIVDGPLRLTYAQWYRKISALIAGFDELGLMPGDHLRDLAAEPLGSRDNPLGLPIRRHRHHPGELARQGR